MARYIDAEQFRGKHEVAEVNGKLNSVILYGDIVNAPTADVAPKSEIAREIFEEIDQLFDLVCHMIGVEIISFPQYAELKKKYTEEKE